MEKFNIIISSKAQSDLAECIGFVLNVSKDAAIKLANDIYSAINALSTFPERNPIFDMPKAFPFIVRKLIVNKRYIVLYALENSNVIVYRVIDSRRQFDYLIL
ncbi:MAG: type II toxin-antitoxin system RelE/ParE family toxin [Bacilli bacterium]|nr:type II toxin-antitoxin system RelE/ParE family toxin [Bacilli bacterium]